MDNKYSNIISLGFFCSVASELERIGLRSASYPFDWLISDFEGVIRAIESHFEDFLNYENMAQHETHLSFYKDIKYDMQFFHDFNDIYPLKKQLPAVREKYERRINRFYASITSPTLFLRYIESEKEVKWIEQNLDSILELLKNYNEKNSIVWIANTDIRSDFLHIYNVEKDKNDSVARTFLESNIELKNYLESLDYKNRSINLDFYNRKKQNSMKKKKNYRIKLYKTFSKNYSHPIKYK